MAAEAIVSIVLEQLILITGREVAQEVRLVTGVRKEIEKLTSNFEAIQAVLVDAEQRQVKETGANKAVGLWLDKLKDASYDMDDVLDEWNTAMLKFQIEGVENAQILNKNVRFFSSPCFCFRQIALRHDIGVKIKEINEKLASIAKEKDEYHLNVIRSNEEPQRSKTIAFIEVSGIRGRDKEKNNLVNKLLSESKQERASLPVISLVGLGGIGKTTLAQLAYNDIEIKSKFDHRVWVCVSDPFDEVRIARAIIEGLTSQATNLVEFQSLMECIRQTIVNKKFLLILDDVWRENNDKWELLYNSLNDGLHGESRILVTTRNEKVAQMMKSIVINIGVLSAEESWELFKQFAFYNWSQEDRENFENIGREIVGMCKGLPLAIKTIGSSLCLEKYRDQWQIILDSEMWQLKLENDIFPILLLSYNRLLFMEKRCLLYCAIFPKDYVMEKDELVKLWMAQGYLGLKHNVEMEIIGDKCFNTLAMHSFFQEFEKDEYGNIYKCKMHDIVHDFAQFVLKNECFSKEIYGGEEASLGVSCEKARHSMLILKSSNDVNISSVQKLRSLLIEDEHRSRSMSCFSPDLFEQMTCLRSLKLSRSWDNKIPSEIGKLIHLRHLNMSGLNIKELPETMCCLYNLQTLNISYCYSLEKLPKGMEKLINLRHLINGGTDEVRYMPKGMERLVCLRRLDRFIVGGDPNGMGLGCLKNLDKLRGRLLLEGLGEVVDAAEAKNAQLMNKKNLVHLELDFESESEISSVEECNKDSAVLEALQPPPNLERLRIEECRSISLSPHWMVSLIHLKKVHLRNCRNCEYLPALGKLPRLEDLRISDMKSVKRVGNEFVGIETSSSSSSSSPSLIAFPKLKTLDIYNMENWEEWEYKITAGDITIMPSLSHLSIRYCPKLKSLLDHLLHAISLEQLTIEYCNCEYLPALGKLPLLEYLRISGMESVKRVGNEFVGIETSSSSSSPSLIAFPKLKTLEIRGMENWEEWEYKITAGDITIMPSLSDLFINGCSKLKSLPDQLLHCTSLEKLTIYGCNCEYLPALGKLPCLEELDIRGMKSVKRVGNEFVGIETSSSSSSSPSLIAFPKLKTLEIDHMENWEEWEYKITAGDITIMPSLSHLYIYNCPKLKSLPDHLLHSTSLEKLHIRGFDCEDFPALGKLPRLEDLTIRGMSSVKRVGNEFVGIETSSSSSSSPSLIAFPKLKTLEIGWMENWEEWEYKITAGDITIMPSLSFLEIRYCPKLKSLPDHLLHATTLETLNIFQDCFILEQVYEVEEGENGKNILKRK